MIAYSWDRPFLQEWIICIDKREPNQSHRGIVGGPPTILYASYACAQSAPSWNGWWPTNHSACN